MDRYKRPYPISAQEEEQRQAEREEYLQKQVNDLWRTIPKAEQTEEDPKTARRFPSEPQENILYFLEKNSPLLESWQREIIRIVRKIAQYFYPQRQTQVMNEGWACFWHYTLLNELHARGMVTDGFMLEFLQSHTSVIAQLPYDHPYFSGINPYTLGFSMMMDIRRICENPTAEDRDWFPDIAGKDWNETLHFAMRNFKDESFILQFLSPKVMRDLKLFSIVDDDHDENIEVSAIHNETGFRKLREMLAGQYNLGNREPNIQIYNVNVRGDRSLTLHHTMHERKPLADSVNEVLRHLHRLWGFDVHLYSVDNDEIMAEYHCPSKAENQPM